ncbi:hypothetical protein [Gottfriedia acidiceleris]|uniref:hypothetical protein n=1 Tax=Gottfriedia acidiceleris TaxID=371036 RepID=UPI002FFE2FFE
MKRGTKMPIQWKEVGAVSKRANETKYLIFDKYKRIHLPAFYYEQANVNEGDLLHFLITTFEDNTRAVALRKIEKKEKDKPTTSVFKVVSRRAVTVTKILKELNITIEQCPKKFFFDEITTINERTYHVFKEETTT